MHMKSENLKNGSGTVLSVRFWWAWFKPPHPRWQRPVIRVCCTSFTYTHYSGWFSCLLQQESSFPLLGTLLHVIKIKIRNDLLRGTRKPFWKWSIFCYAALFCRLAIANTVLLFASIPLICAVQISLTHIIIVVFRRQAWLYLSMVFSRLELPIM